MTIHPDVLQTMMQDCMTQLEKGNLSSAEFLEFYQLSTEMWQKKFDELLEGYQNLKNQMDEEIKIMDMFMLIYNLSEKYRVYREIKLEQRENKTKEA